jgi:hypothetical protein
MMSFVVVNPSFFCRSWIQKHNINVFGHFETDCDMLQEAKRKSPHRLAEVKRAYRHVCPLLKINPELAHNHVFPQKRKSKK